MRFHRALQPVLNLYIADGAAFHPPSKSITMSLAALLPGRADRRALTANPRKMSALPLHTEES
jgi:hypothetical protein